LRIFLSEFGFAIFPLFSSFITKEEKKKKRRKERMENRAAEEENHFLGDLAVFAAGKASVKVFASLNEGSF